MALKYIPSGQSSLLGSRPVHPMVFEMKQLLCAKHCARYRLATKTGKQALSSDEAYVLTGDKEHKTGPREKE